ncbi:sensor histidine kinase [Glaciihabitans sp. dw_435]|uniref:sensor histidine kinase n=1 Tax=Glaciihabitans sp. dw_435 TaxID=2720081 RepID=UPI001BD2AFB6|nr:histidine kinase [Glaciihabitans sp. dw_435]
MITWLDDNSDVLLPMLSAASVVLLVLTIVLLVLWLRSRHLRREQAFDREDAERDRVDLELALAEQTARLRIIRELHEVAIHSVSVIISQAEGARYAGEQDPTAALRSVAGIADGARSTLADLRRVMTVVREGEADGAPQPRLKSARELFKMMREAGLVLTYEETGERFDLVPGAELAVFRILQESLSNSLKHGGEGTEVKISFAWTEEGLRLLIDDDGERARQRRAGLNPNQISRERVYDVDENLSALTEEVSGAGITEMRERAALFGGVFTAYSVPGVGFSVAAAFPALRFHNGVHGVNLDA